MDRLRKRRRSQTAPDLDDHYRRFAREIEMIALMTRRQICRIFAKGGVKLIRVR